MSESSITDPPTEPSRPAGARRPPMPRWVKAFALTVIVLVVLTAALMMLTGSRHGPGRHLTGAPLSTAEVPIEPTKRSATSDACVTR